MGYLMKPFGDGIVTGLFLQMALGPVFFYILGITVDSNYLNSLAAVMAVTLADYIFIALSLLGIGRLLMDARIKKNFGLAGAVVLLVFGLLFFQKGLVSFETVAPVSAGRWTPVKSFTSCFILTISSPLTIVFWGSIFSAKAVEKDYIKKQLVVFGLGAGASTFVFLSLAMLVFSFFKSGIPQTAVQVLNCIVGVVLVYYGLKGTAKAVFQNREVI